MRSFLIFFVLVLCDFGCGRRANSRSTEKSVANSRSTETSSYLTKPKQATTIPVMIHLDSALTMKLVKEHRTKNRKKLKEISQRLLKDVESFFHHRSLNQTLRFKLIDTRFLKNRKNLVTMDENASKYLKSYCDWQSGIKMWRKKWYYSVLLTSLDLYYVNSRGEQVRRSTGRGYMGGMCNIKKSCTLIEWHPKNTAFLLAHEIGHSMGLSHDGPPFNHCKGNHVMNTRYNRMKHPKTWSPCSQLDLKRYLQSGKSWCVRTDENESFGY